MLKGIKGKEKQALQKQIERHNIQVHARLAPAARGEVFQSLPQLCVLIQGELELLEPEIFLSINDWSLLDYPVELPNFILSETSNTFSIDIDGKKVKYQLASQNSLDLNIVDAHQEEHELVRWLDQQARQPDITQGDLIAYLTRLISHLVTERNITLMALYRARFPLAKAVSKQIELLRDKASRNGYTESLFGNEARVSANMDFSYEFKPEYYPAHPPYYSGRYQFKKHYYDKIEDLKADGEEFMCAQILASQPQVKHWIRNLVKRPEASFWLPLANNKFYPDFIVELNDGRMLVVEYKGDAYKTNDDSKEKNTVGQLWASKSSGQCLFLMAVMQDDKGRGVMQQILDMIS